MVEDVLVSRGIPRRRLEDRDSSEASEEGSDEVLGGFGGVGGLGLGWIGSCWLVLDDSHRSEFVVAVDFHRRFSSSVRLVLYLGSDGSLEHVLENVEERSEGALELGKKDREMKKTRRSQFRVRFKESRDDQLTSELFHMICCNDNLLSCSSSSLAIR